MTRVWLLMLCSTINARLASSSTIPADGFGDECSDMSHEEATPDMSFMQVSTNMQIHRLQDSSRIDETCVDNFVVESLDPAEVLKNGVFQFQQARMNNLRNTTNYSFIIDALCSGGACHEDTDELPLESSHILPSSGHLMHLLSQCRSYKWLNVSLDDLNNYITFTRFTSGLDKISCDWCSLQNGLAELFLDKLKSTSPTKFQWIPKKFEVADVHNETDFEATPEQLASFWWRPQEEVALLIHWRNINEYLESRWCPFKHLVNINFNRSYYALSPAVKSDLEQAQSILREKKRITGEDVTCDQCNKVVNEKLKLAPAEISFFDKAPKGVSYMDLVRCALGIECRMALRDVPGCA